MKFFHSIRWRLQLWHGLLLVSVLTGFGFTAWRLQRATQFQHVDQELDRQVQVIFRNMRGPGGKPPGPPPHDGFRPRGGAEGPGEPGPNRNEEGPHGPRGMELPKLDPNSFVDEAGRTYYCVTWSRGEREMFRSPSAPPDVPCPDAAAGPRDARLRGNCRELFFFMPPGDRFLIGRDVSEELAAMRRFAWLLAGAGSVVLLLGLAGGWWVSTRALNPIGAISAAAARISTGDLTQRIQTADTSSELGQLASVLNETFARLQASFDRQAQFTADASHELRTPVSVVLTQTQSALHRERSGAEYRESLAACQRAAQRMRRLTESLLTLARLDTGEATAIREPCELDRLAREATEPLRPIAEEQKVTLEVESTPTRCEGNAEQLGRVVTNLVSNAICYNRPGGSVRVKVAAEPGAAVLTVTDTGQGIAPEHLPHLFERFYRADDSRNRRNGGGAGLGLAICKAIADAHHAALGVTSTQGQGSTFTLRIPVTPAGNSATPRAG
jgi:two-component system, OmpR family, sensor kinase